MKRYLPILALVTLAACGTSDDAQSGESEVVVGLGDLSNKVFVHPDSLEFDADVVASLEKNGVLSRMGKEPVYFVGNRQSDALAADGSIKANARNPSGYLRRALSWKPGDGGTLVVTTEPASFADAVEEIKRTGFVGLKPQAGENDGAPGNWDKTVHHAFDTIDVIDLSGKELWSKPLLRGGTARLVLTKGRIAVHPTLDAHIVIENFKPKEGQAVLSTTVDGELEVEARADGYFELANQSGKIFSKSWGGATAGGVPLTLSIDVNWSCKAAVDGRAVASVGGTASGTLRAGASYQGNQLSGILDKPTYELGRLGPTVNSNISFAGECHLEAELGVQLFDTAGPQASADIYAVGTANAHTAQLAGEANANLKAGVELRVGGSLRPFGVKIADIELPAYRYEKELFNGSITIGKR
jgi:hypothetical protein